MAFSRCHIVAVLLIHASQCLVFCSDVGCRTSQCERLVKFSTFVSDITHEIINLLNFRLALQRPVECKCTMSLKALPFSRKIRSFPIHARFIPMFRHYDCFVYTDHVYHERTFANRFLRFYSTTHCKQRGQKGRTILTGVLHIPQ